MSREAMQLALEALGEIEWSNDSRWQSDRSKVAITALRQALEQPALLDLSKFTPVSQQQMREWLADGSFAQRAIDTMFSLSEEITALKKQPEQKPVISTDHGPWIPSTLPGEEGETYCKRCLLRDKFFGLRQCDPHLVYRDPPQRTWFGLTDEDEIPWDGVDAKSFARAIEAKLKEKNT